MRDKHPNISSVEDLKDEEVKKIVDDINKQFNENWKRKNESHGGTVADYKPTNDGSIPK